MDDLDDLLPVLGPRKARGQGRAATPSRKTAKGAGPPTAGRKTSRAIDPDCLEKGFQELAAACLPAAAMAPLRTSTPMEVWEAYLGELYRGCADPEDLFQRILVEEIAWAHQAIAGLLARAAAGSGQEAATCAAAACRPLGEVRRLVLAVEANKHSAHAGPPGELRGSLETPARSKRIA